jgi:hypothetical protein
MEATLLQFTYLLRMGMSVMGLSVSQAVEDCLCVVHVVLISLRGFLGKFVLQQIVFLPDLISADLCIVSCSLV